MGWFERAGAALGLILWLVVGACGSHTPSARPARAERSVTKPVAVAPMAQHEQQPEAEPESLAERSNPLGAADRERLFSCWFERPYEYMFDGGGGVTVAGRSYGTFTAGVRGILYYGHLNECAGAMTGKKPRTYSDDTPFAALSGLPIYSERMHEDRPFGFYNPELIEWGRRHLIPDPQARIAGVRAQDLYDHIFSRFFRMMTEARRYVFERRDAEREMKAYLQAVTGTHVDGVEWLQSQYAGALSRYGGGRDGTRMTPQMAIGFWLRRSIDGTQEALWSALRDVMRRYDRAWLESLRRGDAPAAGRPHRGENSSSSAM